MAEPTLLAGAAERDITPELGTHLAGASTSHRPALAVGEPLYARALVLQLGERRICIISLDVTLVTARYSTRIREAATQLGFEPSAVLVHAIQTHSAPSLGYIMLDDDFPALPDEFEWVRGAEQAYCEFACNRAIEALSAAAENLRPARVGAASAIEGRMAHNRRAVGRDGRVRMPGRTWEEPLGPTWIRYIEGPIDPELGVVCVEASDGEPIALLLHYTCHPVHVFPRQIISPDWPGAWADEMKRLLEEPVVPLVINGACGNINPWPPFDPGYREDHTQMGAVLAAGAQSALDAIQSGDDAEVAWATRHLSIPIRPVPPRERAWAEELLARQPMPSWTGDGRGAVDVDWMRAASIYSVHLQREREGHLDYEVQVLRIGDTGIVGLPGEPFVEGQLRIKIGSPTYPTYVAHATTQYVGYIPTAEALGRGGHEVDVRYWAKLAPEALDTIVDGALGLLAELFTADGPSR